MEALEPGNLGRITYFAVPIADYWQYVEFLKDITRDYEHHMHAKKEKISKKRDAIMRAFLPGGGEFDPVLDDVISQDQFSPATGAPPDLFPAGSITRPQCINIVRPTSLR